MIHLNDHFIFKTMCLFVGSEFLASHHRLHKPRPFYYLSPLGTMSNHNWRVFHPREFLSLLANTRHIFSLPLYSTVRLCWTLSHLTEPTQANTKRSVDSSTMHSLPFNAMSPCISNAICHCMLYHATYMMNVTWTTQSTPLTGCHGQSHHLHMNSIHHFIHVNISYKHISTFTCNMSFYVQAMTHPLSSHVMTICTYKLITCQYIRTHILTSKHVTLNQAMTLSNQSYNGPRSKP